MFSRKDGKRSRKEIRKKSDGSSESDEIIERSSQRDRDRQVARDRALDEGRAITFSSLLKTVTMLNKLAILFLLITIGKTMKIYPCKEQLADFLVIVAWMTVFLALSIAEGPSCSNWDNLPILGRLRKTFKEKYLSHSYSSISTSGRILSSYSLDNNLVAFEAKKYAKLGMSTMILVNSITMLVLLLLHLYLIFLFVMILDFCWIFANVCPSARPRPRPRDSYFSNPSSVHGITSSSRSSLMDSSYITEIYVEIGYRIHNTIVKLYSKLMKKE